jgi:glycosyltransferase involved in cell wall biosynthesis
MRVGLDARPLLGKRTGVGNYTYNLIKYLGEIDQNNEYSLFYTFLRCKSSNFFKIEHPNFQRKAFRFPSRLLELSWRYFPLFSIESLIGEMDIFHSTNFVSPYQKRGKSVITIHDLGFMISPQEWPNRHVQTYFRKWVPLCAENADLLIADSQNTRKDIIKLLEIPEEKIRVIYIGIDEIYQPGKHKNKPLSLLKKLPRKYILFTGTLEPRKNLTRLIQSFSLFKKEGGKEKLVIVGEKGWSYESIFEAVEKLNLEKEVIFAGYLPQEDLASAYQGASLFLFPSLYEGFGLPPLEAMASGVPVVASRTSSLPEVLGEAAILVDPYNIEEIAQAMKNVLRDEDLRLSLIEKGLARAKLFSWEKAARKTLEVYKELCASP